MSQLQHWAVTQPHALAVSDGTRSLNYAQLLVAAQQAAVPLAAPGLWAGGPAERLFVPDKLGQDPPTLVVLSESSVVDLAVQWCAALLRGEIAMVLDVGWPPSLRAELQVQAQQWVLERAKAPTLNQSGPAFLLGLSSGTSGKPKGFLRSAPSWRESFVQSCAYFDLTPESVTLAPGPVAASMNLYALGESLFAGAGFIAPQHFSPNAAVQLVADHGVTHLVVVPALLELMAARGAVTVAESASLQHIICAGAALGGPTREQARRWVPHARMHQYYGAAELGFVAASTVSDDAATSGVGSPFPGVQLSITNEQGTELPPGQVGNICVRSPFVCDGYAWGDDGLAFAAVAPKKAVAGSPEPWYTVHDQGWIDAAGLLHVAGRASDMIVTAGANVYPQGIESALGAAASASVVVTGVFDALRGQRVAAAIHCPPGRDEAASLAACREGAAQLPASHRPTRWYALAALPLTGSGKVSRKLLGSWIEQEDPRVRRL